MGKSLPNKSFELFPKSYKFHRYKTASECRTCVNDTFQDGGTGWGSDIASEMFMYGGTSKNLGLALAALHVTYRWTCLS